MNDKKTLAAAIVAAGALAWSALAGAQGGGFAFRGLLGRIITPNGDLRNDYAIFCLDNPSQSGVESKIYTLGGAHVTAMSESRPLGNPPPGGAPPVACPAGALPGSAQFVFWDGRAGGSAVRSGVYVYQIKAEGRSFTGTLVVVR